VCVYIYIYIYIYIVGACNNSITTHCLSRVPRVIKIVKVGNFIIARNGSSTWDDLVCGRREQEEEKEEDWSDSPEVIQL
jgi:hypothetical protein